MWMSRMIFQNEPFVQGKRNRERDSLSTPISLPQVGTCSELMNQRKRPVSMTEIQKPRGEEDGENLLECLQTSIKCMIVDLAQVTHLRHAPQAEAIDVLVQECEKVRLLLPLLRALPASYEYNILMRIDNLPDRLASLEIEAHLLYTPQFPTRALLEQQVNVNNKGQQVIDKLTEILQLLQRRQEGVFSVSASDDIFQRSFKAHRRSKWRQGMVAGLLILPGSALITLSIACAIGIWRLSSYQLLLAMGSVLGCAMIGGGLLVLSMSFHKA